MKLQMPHEVYAHPTIKEVIFQIRFPLIFSMENKIGDFQDRIIDRFPDSSQSFQRQVVFADTGIEGKLENIPDKTPESTKKIWTFKSPENTEVHVQLNALDITSTEYKSYDNPQSTKKFRKAIEDILSNFFAVVNIPIIKRVGLRYLDECPLPAKDNATLSRLYNTVIPLDKFDIAATETAYFAINTKRVNHKLIYQEALGKNEKGEDTLILDFDGFEENIASREVLTITDQLHAIINDEYFRIIKEPIIQYMKTGVIT